MSDYTHFPKMNYTHFPYVAQLGDNNLQTMLDKYEQEVCPFTIVTCEQEINHILCSIGLSDAMGEYGSLMVGDTSHGEYELVLGVTSNHSRLTAWVYNLTQEAEENRV